MGIEKIRAALTIANAALLVKDFLKTVYIVFS